jgi:hypothetical protein
VYSISESSTFISQSVVEILFSNVFPNFPSSQLLDRYKYNIDIDVISRFHLGHHAKNFTVRQLDSSQHHVCQDSTRYLKDLLLLEFFFILYLQLGKLLGDWLTVAS